jgi:hypothetical protein
LTERRAETILPVASLKPDAETPNKEVQELGKAIDDTITATNAKIGAIRPQYPVRLQA